ncbi:MAG: segregation/condensation protein A [Clostridiaceae bacterium]|nr:segregation/condensation protein A [Clostridiaceae bacterium]
MSSALTNACTLKLDNFEGPFDLLFYLIEKNKIDIYDIPIAEITDQYMDYLNTMQRLDLEIASEFLVMAATLLHIKSRMLLPSRETVEETEEIDPREELILRLVEYKKYKEFASYLKEQEKKWELVHYKLPEVIPDIIVTEELNVSGETLRSCYVKVMSHYKGKIDDVSKKMKRILNREKVSLRAKIREVMDIIGRGIKICFSKMYNTAYKSRLEVATVFLAILEVAKLGRASIEQPKAFGEIYVTGKKTGE